MRDAGGGLVFGLGRVIRVKQAIARMTGAPIRKTIREIRFFTLERLTGIGPVSHPWQGRVLPLNHNRKFNYVKRPLNITAWCLF